MSSQNSPPNQQGTPSRANARQLSLARPVHNNKPPLHPATPLRPFVSCVDGQQHPDFPLTVQAFYRLTSQQLDSLTWFYHQVYPPVEESTWYPRQMKPWIGVTDEEPVTLGTKRRRFGRFIGLYSQPDPLRYRPSFDFTHEKVRPKAKSKLSRFFSGCFGVDE